jgi:fucose permease
MALGRYALGAVTETIGLHTAVSTYITMACCAQFLLMGLHQIAGNLIVLGVCGFFLAPLFPSGIVMLSNRTPARDRTEVIAAVIAMGQVGVAIVPYAMGLLATHLGTQYLLHVTLGLSVVLLALWIAISQFEDIPEPFEDSEPSFIASSSAID